MENSSEQSENRVNFRLFRFNPKGWKQPMGENGSEKVRVLSYAFKLLWSNSPWLTGFYFIVSCLGGLTTVLEARSISSLVNKLVELFPAKEGQKVLIASIPWILLLLSAMSIKQLVSSIRPIMSAYLNERIIAALKAQCYEKALAINLISFERSEYDDKLTHAKRATNRILVTGYLSGKNAVTCSVVMGFLYECVFKLHFY